MSSTDYFIIIQNTVVRCMILLVVDGSLTCRPAIDDEVAHSLLDLSKNVAAANSEGENDGSCSDSQKGISVFMSNLYIFKRNKYVV